MQLRKNPRPFFLSGSVFIKKVVKYILFRLFFVFLHRKSLMILLVLNSSTKISENLTCL